MPSFEKELMVKEITKVIEEGKTLIITNFSKLSMAKLEELRGDLKKHSAKYVVVKNSLARRALKNLRMEELGNILSGTVGIGFSGNDPIGVSKIFMNFSGENEAFVVLGGWVDGEVQSVDSIKEISKLSSKEAVVVKLLGSLNSPINGLYGVLSGLLRGLVVCVSQIEKKKSNSN